MALTQEDIWAAAHALEQAGAKVTLAAVRGSLGGGSFTTISNALAERRRVLQQRDRVAQEPLPQTLVEKLESLGRDIWNAATHKANERVRMETEAFGRERAELERSRDELAEVATQTAADHDSATRRAQEVEQQLACKCRDLEELRQQLVRVDVKLAEHIAHAAEAERRICDLNRELERVNELNRLLAGASMYGKGAVGSQPLHPDDAGQCTSHERSVPQ